MAYWLRRGLLLELWGYLSILRFVLRRPKVPPGATAFGYASPVLPLLWAFLVVSAVELVVVDLLVRRWPSVRIGLLVLGVWGLVWMVGLLLGFLTRPHAVGPDGIRVRSGAELDLPFDWDVVEAVVRRRRTAPDEKALVTTDEQGGRTLHLRMQSETNVELALRRPVTVRLARGPETVHAVHLFADRPEDFVAAARRQLASRLPR